ncbi:MAG TPA: protein-disulfide reductase DsbD domain-containing protein [Burkholderiaceae bacterium]
MTAAKKRANSIVMAGLVPAIHVGVLALGLTSAGFAQAPPDSPVSVELVAAQDGVAPGTTATVAVRLVHRPHWHTYWRVPGDAGLPTRISWQLPAGFSAGEIGWPIPHRLPVGPLMDYGYEGEVMLLTDLSAPAGLKAGETAQIGAQVKWLMCRDVCIPGSADLKLALPVREAAALHPTRWQPAIAAARAQLPQPRVLDHAQARAEATRIRLSFKAPGGRAPSRLEFYPLDPGWIDAPAPQTLSAAGDGTITLELAAAEAPGPDFRSLRGVLVADGGPGLPAGWAATIDVALTR